MRANRRIAKCGPLEFQCSFLDSLAYQKGLRLQPFLFARMAGSYNAPTTRFSER